VIFFSDPLKLTKADLSFSSIVSGRRLPRAVILTYISLHFGF